MTRHKRILAGYAAAAASLTAGVAIGRCSAAGQAGTDAMASPAHQAASRAAGRDADGRGDRNL